MYCAIQEIKLKKLNKFGEHKELIADSYTYTIGGVTKTKYTYGYGHERFERPIKRAYKISIHESRRVKAKNIVLDGDVEITGNLIVKKDISVEKNLIVMGDAMIKNSVAINEDLMVEGLSTLKGGVTAGGESSDSVAIFKQPVVMKQELTVEKDIEAKRNIHAVGTIVSDDEEVDGEE